MLAQLASSNDPVTKVTTFVKAEPLHFYCPWAPDDVTSPSRHPADSQSPKSAGVGLQAYGYACMAARICRQGIKMCFRTRFQNVMSKAHILLKTSGNLFVWSTFNRPLYFSRLLHWPLTIFQCLFYRNFKLFEEYYKNVFSTEEDTHTETEANVPRVFFKSLRHLSTSLEEDKLQWLQRITFRSYCNSYKNNFDFIYKCVIILTGIAGFDVSNHFKAPRLAKTVNTSCHIRISVLMLTEILTVLNSTTPVLSASVSNVVFSDCLQSLCASVIASLPAPNSEVYSFLKACLAIDPLLAEKMLDVLLHYSMLSDNSGAQDQYESFLVAIFGIFSKLHRIQNLISKLTRVIKAASEGSTPDTTSTLTFSGDRSGVEGAKRTCDATKVFPAGVLNSFTDSIVAIASWQLINLFKTLLFHLKDALSNITGSV